MTAVLIDLGDDWGTGRAPEPEPPAGRRGPLRRAAMLACAVLCALTVTAAAPAPPRRLTELARWFQPVAAISAVGSDTFLVNAMDGVAAYGATDGRLRWRIAGGLIDWVQDTGDVVVLGFAQPESTSSQPRLPLADAVAVDRRTGRVLWRTQAYLEQVAGLLVSYAGDPDRPAVEVRDPATFGLRWRVPGARSFALDRWGTGLWELAADGKLVEHDLASGAVRRSARVPLPPGDKVSVVVSRDAVGIAGRRFDADGFERTTDTLWYARADLAPVGGENRWPWVVDCGAGTSCAYPLDRGKPQLIDTATGTPIRPLEDTRHVGSPAGLLLFEAGDEVGSKIRARVEPMRHQERTDVAGWQVLSVTEQVAHVLGRVDQARTATHLAELTADGMRPLGRQPYVLMQCVSVPHALLCTTTGGDVVIWRVGRERA
ncbi:hypothetical protein Cme02nite_44460 [Catellatospora methionotrophica]|uniref:Uncharacterized protein n=1 Tax=Catellatospora methionotrophica TaxID=121620 RepID=A0A8J3PGW5_9ACTN|nr:hypothetical protein [Catellatospora methionotrophica]GIG16114.1 hypothetical protein Cme02nite_44460 [Catellatospora methionotrophica]